MFRDYRVVSTEFLLKSSVFRHFCRLEDAWASIASKMLKISIKYSFTYLGMQSFISVYNDGGGHSVADAVDRDHKAIRSASSIMVIRNSN